MNNILLLFILAGIAEKELDVIYRKDSVRIDGIISEQSWKYAAVIRDFIQLMPQKGGQPSESTIVYVMYDNANLYIGAKCFDNPDLVKANTTIRDHSKVGWDDGLGIFLCPDEKERMVGYVFLINAIGTQLDGKLYDGGNNAYNEWDGVWQSATSISEDGWSAEIAIPFRILELNENTQEWGFNVVRGIIRKMELLSWCNVSNQNKIDEWGKVKGIEVKNPSKRLNGSFLPYSLIFVRQEKFEPKIGIDAIKFNISDKFKSEITLNPDYAHIEADIDEFNLDKLPQWLPEKRAFFIEDLGIFDTPITLLYTRSISNILTGLKVITQLSGIDGGFLGTALDTTSKEMTLAGRIRKSFNRFNLGFLGISNINPENKVLDFDASFNLPKQIYLSGQAAKSWLDKNESDILYYFSLKRAVDVGLNFTAHYKYIPKDFEDVRGYIPMTDLISSQISVTPKFQLNRWIIRDFSITSGYLIWQTNAHNKIKESIWGGIGFTFLKNIMSSFYYTDEVRIYNSARYDNKLLTLTTSYIPGGISGFGLNCTYGDYWGGKIIYPSLNFNYTLFKNFSNSLVLDYQIFKHPDGTADSALIFVYIPSISFLKNLNFRAFIQRSDKSNILMTNFLLDWAFFRGSKLYIALNRTKATDTGEESWIFFSKISSCIWF